jgi:putative ABC transport system ATP-binding protein
MSSTNTTDTAIALTGLGKTYKTGVMEFAALKNLNLSLLAGEFVALLGKSGSGKSTLLNMLTGIDRPSTGSVVVLDTDLTQLSEDQLALWRGQNVGIVFQFFQLMPTLSLLENIIMPMEFCGRYTPAERQVRAMVLLDQMGIAAHAHKLPLAVSGGQQQRAAIARALANDPPLLVADEPTGNLDSKTADEVIGLFDTLTQQGKTVLMVTHDDDLALRASRIVTLKDGQIVSDNRCS